MLIREECGRSSQGKKVAQGRCGKTIEAKPFSGQTCPIEPAGGAAVQRRERSAHEGPTRPRPPLGSADLDSTTSVSCALSGGTISRRASHEQTGPVEGQLPHGGEASLQMGAIISSCDDSLGLGRSGSGIIEVRSENRRMPGAAAANQDPPHLDPRTAFQGRKRQPSGSVSGHRCAPCRTRRIRTVVSVTT